MGAAQTDTTTWTNQLTIVDTLYTSGNLGAYPMDAANAVELGVHIVDPTTGESDLQHLHGYAHLQATTVYRQRAPGREGTRRAPETLRERGGISARLHSELWHDFAVAQGADAIKWCPLHSNGIRHSFALPCLQVPDRDHAPYGPRLLAARHAVRASHEERGA